MIAVMLLMFAGGVGLTLAVSDPRQVTLRWLRLGGLVALSLLAVAAAVHWRTAEAFGAAVAGAFAVTAAAVIVQLLGVQLAQRPVQRFAAAVAFAAAALGAGAAMQTLARPQPVRLDRPAYDTRDEPAIHDLSLTLHPVAIVYPTAAASAGLLGGFLMTMLLGHAYLTAGGEMTQAPFRRLVLMLAVLLALRAACSALGGLLPWLGGPAPGAAGGAAGAMDRLWTTVMLSARYAVGLAVPALFTCMTFDCVKRRANQSATGILYVAGILVIVGEGIALALLGATGLAF